MRESSGSATGVRGPWCEGSGHPRAVWRGARAAVGGGRGRKPRAAPVPRPASAYEANGTCTRALLAPSATGDRHSPLAASSGSTPSPNQ